MLPQADDDWISEHELATLLNVPRKALREHRRNHITLPDDAWKITGLGVLWKKTAAQQVAKEFGVVTNAFSEKIAPAANGEAAAPDPEETLTVFSDSGAGGHHFPNPRVIKARRANGEVVIVNVVDSAKYTRVLRNGQPMTFSARKSPAGNFWRLTGREPRYRGQW